MRLNLKFKILNLLLKLRELRNTLFVKIFEIAIFRKPLEMLPDRLGLLVTQFEV